MKNTLELSHCIIQPGHLAFSREPSVILTVCGNGLVLTIRDRFRSVGAIAHCIYPKARSGEKSTHYHADVAIRSLVKVLGRSPVAHEHRFEAQLIGGGNYRGVNRVRAEKTAAMMRKLLKKLNIPLVSEDTGGTLGRKVVFHTSTGETTVLKTSRIRRSDWLPEMLEAQVFERVAFQR